MVDEVEINLKSMFFYILNRWKSIVAAMVLVGIILGGYSYYQSMGTTSAANAIAEESIADKEARLASMEAGLTESEKALADAIYMYQKEYETVDGTAIMQLNGNDVCRTDLCFFVSEADTALVGDIKAVYKNLIEGGELAAYVSDKCGLAATDVAELINLWDTTAVNTTAVNTTAVNIDTDNVIEIVIYTEDEATADVMKQAVIEYMGQTERRLQGSLGAHKLELTNETTSHGYDKFLMDLKRQNMYTKASLASTISSYKKSYFTTEQTEYLDYKIALDKEKATAEEESNEVIAYIPEKPVISTRYVLLGFLLGALLMACVWAFIYIVSNKLDEDDDLGYIYKIPDLGHIPAGTGKGALFKLRNLGKRVFETDEAIELAAAGIGMSAKKENASRIAIIGCGLKNGTLATAEKLKALLEAGGVQTEIIDNILYNAENLEKISGINGAVLLEKAQSTLRTEIFKELEILNRQGIKVLGGVVQE